jgi:hypothetical protein
MNPVRVRLEEGRSRDILFLDDGRQGIADMEEEVVALLFFYIQRVVHIFSSSPKSLWIILLSSSFVSQE